MLFFFLLDQQKKAQYDFKNKVWLYGLIIILLITYVVILRSESRTALFTSIIILCLYAKKLNNKEKRVPNVVKLVIALMLVFFIYYIFNLFIAKEASLSGRVIMIRIAIIHVFDSFWWGTGLGRFNWFYPQWQASYFENLPPNSNPPLVRNVGETYIIFNEFLQIFLSIGLIGTIVFIALFVIVFRLKSSRFVSLFYTLKCTILGVMVSGITSYTLHVNLLLLILVAYISILLMLNERKFVMLTLTQKRGNFNSFNIIFCVSSLSVVLFLSSQFWFKMSAVSEWHEIREQHIEFERKEYSYCKIYPFLKNDGKFLTDYGIYLLENMSTTVEPKKLDLTIKTLESARGYFLSKDVVLYLGYANWAKGNLKDAISNFEWVGNFLPYLFEPKIALMKLYLETGDIMKARNLGEWIIQTEPKVPSEEVEMIKNEADFLMKHKL